MGFSASHALRRKSSSTAMPAARSAAAPPPETFGFGSREPMTTRATFAAMRASVQGGVRPWWQQGSSVT